MEKGVIKSGEKSRGQELGVRIMRLLLNKSFLWYPQHFLHHIQTE